MLTMRKGTVATLPAASLETQEGLEILHAKTMDFFRGLPLTLYGVRDARVALLPRDNSCARYLPDSVILAPGDKVTEVLWDVQDFYTEDPQSQFPAEHRPVNIVPVLYNMPSREEEFLAPLDLGPGSPEPVGAVTGSYLPFTDMNNMHQEFTIASSRVPKDRDFQLRGFLFNVHSFFEILLTRLQRQHLCFAVSRYPYLKYQVERRLLTFEAAGGFFYLDGSNTP